MVYQAAVRALTEFTAKEGDLDIRFTPSPSGQEGVAGHAVIASRRGSDYVTEISLSGEYQELRIRGRADGYDPGANQLEEYKTHRGDVARIPENHRQLHWAQLRVYGHLLCRKKALEQLNLALVYFDIDTQRETVLQEQHTAASLERFFEEHCERFVQWARLELAHRAARNELLETLRFPHSAFHAGQRQLAEAVYRTARDGGCLMAQAPTGLGKTLGTLFPILKAVRARELDKVFFLVAKTSGRRLALDALRLLRDKAPSTPDKPRPMPDAAPSERDNSPLRDNTRSMPEHAPPTRDDTVPTPDRTPSIPNIAQPPSDDAHGIQNRGHSTPIRVLELVAREKACEYPGNACHGAACSLARGFYDRLPAAREAALAREFLDQRTVRAVALEHNVCPYFLSQELVRWCDVIVADYNYYFDSSASLYSLTLANQWKIAILVDEAHNMIERGRAMYTASINSTALKAARAIAPPAIQASIEKLATGWRELLQTHRTAYTPFDEAPPALLKTIQTTVSTLTTFMTDNLTADPALLQFYFDLIQFSRLAENMESDSVFDLQRTRTDATLCLRNIIPARFLKERFAAASASILFSATFAPPEFYRDMLGLREDAQWLDVDSPFTPDQLDVHIAGSISTRYRHRESSLSKITDVITRQYATRPGNYLAFFSSYDYLERACEALTTRHPHIPIWKQARQMTEVDRDTYLDRFTTEGQGIGFAVLGGAFAEGIDLPGERLIGAFIATLGLPQINPINEVMQNRIGAKFGTGYEYTYLYPGLRKVIQAAGRVIRTPNDRGVIYLIDDRFTQPQVHTLLPKWWTLPTPDKRPPS